jgi:putative ABC transport system permease protein
MTTSPDSVIVSSAFQELGYKVGDTVHYSWGKQSEVDGIIYAFVDYWPSLNPLDEDSKYFVVADLDYVQANTMIEPYQYWIKRDGTTTTAEIYKDISDQQITLLGANNMTDSFKRIKANPMISLTSDACLVDTSQQLIAKKNDALLQGTNGALTLGFMVTMAIAMIGFNIYWVLSIKNRELQFGILRAIGMTKKKVIGILVCEQVMISLVAVLMGVVIGSLTSQLYVPLLSMVYSSTEQVPPFTVVASRSDYFKIYGVITFMLATGFALLGVIVSRIKIAQAIKLGED